MQKMFLGRLAVVFLLTMLCVCFGDIGNITALAETVQLDLDVEPDSYDTTLYSQALSVVYLEENFSGTRQELSLYTDKDSSQNVSITNDEEEGMVTYTFPQTYNAVGEVEQSFADSFVKEITVTTSGCNVVVTVSYRSKCILTSLQDEDGILASFSTASYSMRLKLPEGVSEQNVTDTDYYYKNTFKLKLPGKWKSFYEENPILANNSEIESIKVSNAGSSTLITVKTSDLQGYSYSQQGEYLLVTIDDPRNIYSNIVVLDAGHGGKDNGASHKGTHEKNINYKIIYTLARKYFDSSDSTVKAYWSRYDDTFITLSDRAAFAQKVGADLFVSLHMNSASRSSANGMEVYYSKDNNKTSDMGLTSQILARRMHSRLNNDLSISSRGVKTAGFYVIKHNTVPAILIELGFLSGNRDYSKLTSASYQKKAAKSIYQCIEGVFQAYPTDR